MGARIGALSSSSAGPAGAVPETREGHARRDARDEVHQLRFRRIYILPTRQGWSFLAVLAVMLLGAINYNNALGYVLTFLLGSMSLVSMLHACRNLAGIGLRAADAPPAFAGDHARFVLLADNRGQPRRYALLARYPAREDTRRTAGDDRVVRFALEENAVQRVALPTIAARRGWLTLDRVTIASRFPFGLFRAWSPVKVSLRCLVYPRPAGTRALPPCLAHDSSEGGARGHGDDDFAGLREYRPGDSPRLIHWKSVAREQGVPVKLFAGESSGRLMLRWEDATGPPEARLSQLCLWVLEAEARGFRYGLSLPGEEIALDIGESHRERCLGALALHEAPESDPTAGVTQ